MNTILKYCKWIIDDLKYEYLSQYYCCVADVG